MAREVDARCGQHRDTDDLESRFRVLLLGLGGGELAAHIAKSCGGTDGTASEIEAVELDGRLPVLATRYFGLPSSVKTTVGDALPVVSALEQQVSENKLLADQRRYDTILVDCFSTGGVTPEHCRSPEFVGKLHALLRNGGRVLHHMWHVDERHPQVPTDFSNTIAIYRKIFSCSGCEVRVQPLEGGPDSLIVASYPMSVN
jgi:spermidine synthase